MRKILTLVALLVSSTAWSADLGLNYVHPATVAIDWDGFNDVDGDGTVTFTSLGDSQSATLRVLCNAANGYQLTFNSANATGTDRSELKNGADAIGYTAVMNTTGIANATVVSSNLVLNNVATHSVDVNFNGGGDTLPLDGATQANQVSFMFTLDAFSGTMVPQGTYTDVITATVALN